jgi:hypothetical protein
MVCDSGVGDESSSHSSRGSNIPLKKKAAVAGFAHGAHESSLHQATFLDWRARL